MKVLVIDPGERVGWAAAEILTQKTKQGIRLRPQDRIRPLERGVTPLKDFALKLGKVAKDYDLIVYEHFRIYPDKAKKLIGSELLTPQLIGMIRYIAWTEGVKTVTLSPNQKQQHEKTLPRFLKNWYKDSTEEHDKDAVQLLWAWFFREHV